MLIDILLEKFDMLGCLEHHGYTIDYIGGRTQNLTTCPFCSKEKHLGLNDDTKTFGCFKCHETGDYVKLLQAVLNMNFIQVLNFLKTGAGEIVDIRYIDNAIKEIAPYQELEDKIKPIALPEDYISLYNKRIPYLDTGRTFPVPQEQINYYKMGLCLSGKYKDRIIVCDVNEKQEPIYWVARDVSGKAKKNNKLWNPNAELTQIGSSDILFNYYLAKHYETVIITEGVFDALYVGNNAVASYGKGLKKNHLYWLIRGRVKNAILLYDADVPDEELEKSGLLLSHFLSTRICKLPYGDPDEWPRDKLYELINSCPAFIPSKLDRVKLCLN